MVHLLIALYGEKNLVDSEIQSFINHLDKRGHGSVRELRIVEVCVKEEHLEEFTKILKSPHRKLREIFVNYFRFLGLPHNYEYVFDEREKSSQSPHTIILAKKQEEKYPDGREVL